MKNVFATCLALTSLPCLSLRRLLLATILSFANILDSLVWPTCWFTLGLLMLALNGPTAHAGAQVPLTTPTVVTAAPVMQLSTSASDTGSSERSPFPESENDRLPINGRLPAAPRRKGPRSKAEIEQERRERIERTNREIDEIHADYLAKFERDHAKATGAAYARFSTKFQDSIADQVRTILEFALAQQIYVPRNFVFYDMAIRGFKKNRAGLEQFESCLRQKKASVALFFSTSRLFRKQYRTLEFVDRIHKGLNIRCIFVKSGVDTNDKKQWESILAVQSMVDQFVVSMNVANVQAAHEGLLNKQLVFGTVSFGYTGIVIEGALTKLGRPRRRIAVDPETAAFVSQVYHWYVDEELSINESVQRLNSDPNIPLYQGAMSGQWTRQAVARLLRNSRYRGLWKYGVVETIYNPVGDYNQQRMRAEPLKEIQLDDLRIVPDELWFAAQARLANRNINAGRPPVDGDRHSRPKALNDIYACPKHGRLHVSGQYGKKMHCPVCNRLPAQERELFSDLDRVSALQLICQKLADLVRGDASLVQDGLAACTLEVAAAQRPDPSRLVQLKSQAEQFKRTIALTRRTAGESEEEQQDAAQQVTELQRERAGKLAEIAELEARCARIPQMPTERQTKQLVLELGDIFAEAAQGSDAIDEVTLRQIIDLLTGGKIELHQMGERRKYHGWLQARFEVHLLPYLVEKLTGVAPALVADAIPMVIDLRLPSPRDEKSERAWKLAYEDKLFNVEIAAMLKCSTNTVTALLKYAAKKRGVPYENGYARRASHDRKQRPPIRFQEIADEVVRKLYAGEPVKQIVQAAGVSWDTFRSAVRWWHKSRGLPVPTAGTLRRQVPCEPPTGNEPKQSS